MKHIAVVSPTERDIRELGRIADAYGARVSFLGVDASEYLDSLDVNTLIESTIRWCRLHRPDGVLSSDDYPGSVIAHIAARECGLPHTDPAVILGCQHKYRSRELQTRAVPQAVPRYFLIDPYSDMQSSSAAPLPYPFFVKPVKSFFSILSRKVSSDQQLTAVIEQSHQHFRTKLQPFNELLAKYSHYPFSANYLIGEEMLEGHQVTVEGYMFDGTFTLIGVVDSIMFPGTHSFQRFEFPSALSEEVCSRMADLAQTFLREIGYHNAMVNIEMMYNPASDDIKIIEVNTRLSPQFADLFEKVHGINTYTMLLDLCCGIRPQWQPYQGRHAIAASCVLRTFEDHIIRALPTQADKERLFAAEPDARVELFGSVGRALSAEIQDGMSYRYGLINIGARSQGELLEKFEHCKSLLPFQFEPTLHPATATGIL